MNWGLHNPTFQTFKHFSLEYSDSSVFVARLKYSFIFSVGTMLRLQVPVFSMFIIIVY